MKNRKKFRGRHKFICDIDGMEYYSEDKRIRWDGAICHKDNIESRHPQDLIKAVKEDISVKNPRPEGPDRFVVRTDENDVPKVALGPTNADTETASLNLGLSEAQAALIDQSLVLK